MSNEETKKKLPGIQTLGFPYDITAAYANESAVNTQYALFDLGFSPSDYDPNSDPNAGSTTIGDETYYYPSGWFVVDPGDEHYQSIDTTYKSAQNHSAEFKGGLSAKAGNAIFTGSVKTNFEMGYAESAYFESLSQRNVVQAYRFSLSNPDQLGSYLTPQADADINGPGEMAPEALIEKYATHFITSGVFGGILSYSQSLSRIENSSQAQINSQIDAHYKGYGEAAMYGGAQTDEIGSTTQSDGIFEAWGGSPQALKMGYESWASSVADGNFVLTNFPDQGDPLLPLSVLARDPKRQDDIMAAINSKLEATGSPISGEYLLRVDQTQGEMIDVITEGNDQAKIVVEHNEVIVGYSAYIDKKKIARASVRVMNLDTFELYYKVTGDVSSYSDSKFSQANVDIPESINLKSVALTGMGIQASGKEVTSLKLYYQKLDPASHSESASPGASPTYLDSQLENVSNDNSEGYEAEYMPMNPGEGKVIYGISLGVSSGGNNIDYLLLRVAPLVRVKK